MRIILWKLVSVGVLGTAFAVADDLPDQPKALVSSTPEDEVKLIIQEYENVRSAYTAARIAEKRNKDQETTKALEQAKGDVRMLVAGDHPDRLLAIAVAHPKSDAAFAALSWIAASLPAPAPRSPQVRESLRILTRDHADDPRLRDACSRLDTRLYTPEAEDFLRKVVASNPDHEVQASATMKLALLLAAKEKLDRSLRAGEALAGAAGIVVQGLGPQTVEQIQAADPDTLAAEVESLLKRVIVRYADVPNDRGVPYGEQAKAEMFERSAVGMVAPEISGEDIDGRPLKLSDYRGKVVVLNFWGTWCVPCMAMIPQERALADRLQGRAFALLGINSDGDREKLKRRIRDERITWPSWWDGDIADGPGPIARAWNVRTWPTTYVLDPEGVIRFKNVHGLRLDEAVESLLNQHAEPR